MKVKEAAVQTIRSVFESGRNGARIEHVEAALNRAGFNVKGYHEVKYAAELLGFLVVDSYVVEGR